MRRMLELLRQQQRLQIAYDRMLQHITASEEIGGWRGLVKGSKKPVRPESNLGEL